MAQVQLFARAAAEERRSRSAELAIAVLAGTNGKSLEVYLEELDAD
jgi:hypothetical protein